MGAHLGFGPERTSAVRRAGERRAQILEAVSREPGGVGIRDLAEATGLHENTVRFHLDRLLEDGLIERRAGEASGPGRPPLTFVARPGQRGRDNYELIAQVLSASLRSASCDPESAAREAGRQWGRSRARELEPPVDSPERTALDGLTDLLHETGFAPEVVADPAGATVRVHRCPFLSLSQADQVVPCGVHLGLMEGALEALDAPVRVAELEPFVTPSLCVARLQEYAEG